MGVSVSVRSFSSVGARATCAPQAHKGKLRGCFVSASLVEPSLSYTREFTGVILARKII